MSRFVQNDGRTAVLVLGKNALLHPPMMSIGFENNDGFVVWGITYDLYTGGNIFMHVGARAGTLPPPNGLDMAFSYPFKQLGCRRVSAMIGASQELRCRAVEQMGFEKEAVLSEAGEGEDLFIYCLRKENCKYGR